jgi:hypothetical protein
LPKTKRNHYQVKLLHGYGVSISLKNSEIILKNGSHDITGGKMEQGILLNQQPAQFARIKEPNDL